MTQRKSPVHHHSPQPASIRIRLARAHRDLYPKEDSSHYSKLRKEQSTKEYKKLKKLLPSLSSAPTVSKVDIVNEAVRYIDILHSQIIDKINRGILPPSVLEQLALTTSPPTTADSSMLEISSPSPNVPENTPQNISPEKLQNCQKS